MSYVKRVAINKNRILNHINLIRDKAQFLESEVKEESQMMYRAGHIELQLTDKCTLNCKNCHFRGLGDHSFDFDWIDNIVGYIKPKAITLAGGGEPTIYPKFNEVVLKLSEIPGVDIGLITNGTVVPKGDWVKKISWVRISVYSVDDGMYSGRIPELLDVVLNNIEWYIKESGIDHVGIHFLFYRDNIDKILPFVKNIYTRFGRNQENLNKIHIQFKPAFMMVSPDMVTDKVHKENISLLPDYKQLGNILLDFNKEFSEDGGFRDFCEERSNLGILGELNKGGLEDLIDITRKQDTDLIRERDGKCHVCLAYQLIDPNGYIYPCLTLAEHRVKKFSVGHISDLTSTNVSKLKAFYNMKTDFCNKVFCRNWSQNKITQDYLSGSDNTEIPTDNFF